MAAPFAVVDTEDFKPCGPLVVGNRQRQVSFFADTVGSGSRVPLMTEILHDRMPDDLQPQTGLPGVRPLSGPWLRVDEAYAGQMAYRRRLLSERRDRVLYEGAGSEEICAEVLEEALALLPPMGFRRDGNVVICPDGMRVTLGSDTSLAVLSRLVQEDICLLDKRGDEHELCAAVLCFPASWTLAEKAGRPLTDVHGTVHEYDDDLARRVQRLFDGVQVGRPLWRNNHLPYVAPDLHQPRSVKDPLRDMPAPGVAGYLRAERQSIARLPRTRAVVFSIHSYVVRADTSVDREKGRSRGR
jgi:hypothetical protein